MDCPACPELAAILFTEPAATLASSEAPLARVSERAGEENGSKLRASRTIHSEFRGRFIDSPRFRRGKITGAGVCRPPGRRAGSASCEVLSPEKRLSVTAAAC